MNKLDGDSYRDHCYRCCKAKCACDADGIILLEKPDEDRFYDRLQELSQLLQATQDSDRTSNLIARKCMLLMAAIARDVGTVTKAQSGQIETWIKTVRSRLIVTAAR